MWVDPKKKPAGDSLLQLYCFFNRRLASALDVSTYSYIHTLVRHVLLCIRARTKEYAYRYIHDVSGWSGWMGKINGAQSAASTRSPTQVPTQPPTAANCQLSLACATGARHKLGAIRLILRTPQPGQCEDGQAETSEARIGPAGHPLEDRDLGGSAGRAHCRGTRMLRVRHRTRYRAYITATPHPQSQQLCDNEHAGGYRKRHRHRRRRRRRLQI